MTRSLLSFITLYGLSFSFWGSVGLCRFFEEKRDYLRSQPFLIILALASVVTGSLIFLLPQAGGMAPLVVDMLDDRYVITEILACATVSGLLVGLAAYRPARSFYSKTVLVALSTGYILSLGSLAYFIGWEGQALPEGNQLAIAVVGIMSLAVWVGLVVAREEGVSRAGPVRKERPLHLVGPNDVAVLIPAHNEERSIGACLQAITDILPCTNIYVASDGSTDKTVAVVKEWGCNVAEINPGGGKAKALKELLIRFDICKRYKAVMILDADSEVDPHYLDQALPLFDDPSVAAIAGHAFPSWEQHRRPTWRMFFVGYRVRLYKVTQAFLRYGQTWRYTNVSFIIPGFASMYRTSILPEIDISAPGLIIEDFNMTFEVHHKKLGKIAYTPRTRCMCQDPTTLRDYVKQVKRWDLGLWQTVRRHGVWPSVFWLSLATFMVEVTVQSAIFLTLPFVLVWFLIAPGDLLMFWLPFGSVELRALDVLVGVILADYLLTVIVAVLERKPMLMFYGLGFLVPRWIDAFLFLMTLPMAFFVRSDGRWVSPQRS